MYSFPNYQQQWFPYPQQPQINSRFVTNIEEAKAALIDGISTNLFVDTSTGKIYLKQVNNNGQADFFVYSIEEAPKDPLIEINSRLTRIENYIGGSNDKSVSSDVGSDKSKSVHQSAVTEQNEYYDEAKSSSISKDAGNDKW